MINEKEIASENTVRLLGVKIDHKLSFDEHISDLCRKLNALKRLNSYIGMKAKKALVKSFVF